MFGLDAHALRRFDNAQGGVAREERHHHAGVAGIEVLHQNQGQASAGGQGVHEFGRGVEAAG
jgi:hypothetical protein